MLLAVLAGCAAERSVPYGREYLERANYYQAFLEAERARELEPDNTVIREQYATIRLLYLMDRAQELVFRERAEEAVPLLQEVLSEDPDNAIAKTWLRKARIKLAEKAVRAGNVQSGEGELKKALELYREALEQVPGYPPAKKGVAEVAEIWEERKRTAQSHYLEGMRVMAKGDADIDIKKLLSQCEYHMDIALDNDPEHAQAEDRKARAVRHMAELRYEDAKKMAEKRFYDAALRTFLEVREVLPDHESIDQRIAHMRREVEAQKIIRRGENEMFRGNYDKAREHLEKAYDLSLLERPYISETLRLLRRREIEERYRRALDRELQRDYEAALAAYRELEEMQPAFRDVRTRISDLESATEVASQAYARGRAAEEKGEIAEAIDAYEEALLVYPGYKDLESKVEALKAAAKK